MSQTAIACSHTRRISPLDLPGGEVSPQSNNVDVKDRGLNYRLDRNVGFDIREFGR